MDRNPENPMIRIDEIVALRKESVDRNHAPKYHQILLRRSLSARRAWIEISTRNQPGKPKAVALRKESVDRNSKIAKKVLTSMVALRKESVDRNSLGANADSPSKVALRKESVDRNCLCGGKATLLSRSLSARRAWIEMDTAG